MSILDALHVGALIGAGAVACAAVLALGLALLACAASALMDAVEAWERRR